MNTIVRFHFYGLLGVGQSSAQLRRAADGLDIVAAQIDGNTPKGATRRAVTIQSENGDISGFNVHYHDEAGKLVAMDTYSTRGAFRGRRTD